MFLEDQSKARFARLMRETDFHALAPSVPAAALDDETGGTLNLIAQTADQAKPRGD